MFIITSSQEIIGKNLLSKTAKLLMKPPLIISLFAILILTAACTSTSASDDSPEPSQTISDAAKSEQGNADVLYVVTEQQADLTWTFSVTISHPDTGWEDYADGWDVVLPDGTVLKNNPSDPFTRLLAHPHVDEQPFTRSQSGILIPENEQVVIVRAHDLIDGFGGETVVVNLELPFGEDYEVKRANPPEVNSLGLANQNLDGNRYVTGQIDLVNAHEINIPLNGTPAWVVGVPQPDNSSIWLAALEDGTLQMFQVDRESYSEVQPQVVSIAPGAPPALRTTGSGVEILNTRQMDGSPYTFPLFTPGDQLVYITNQGNLTIQSAEQSISLPINALPDGRILSDTLGNLLLLSEPTSFYQHAVLGDGLEAQSITSVKYQGETPSMSVIPVPEGKVVEGIAPIWVDLNSDGGREILVTLSDARVGAQLVVYSEAGEIIASSSAIGTGYRWRHQIAAAPFGPNGEMEIVDVLTPHIGGLVEFFQIEGNNLTLTAQIGGYTSHVIGSRNLNMALAADVDADGQVELLLPNQRLNGLGAIQRTVDGAEVAFELPLGGKLSTNIATVKFENRTIGVALGLDIGSLKIWIP